MDEKTKRSLIAYRLEKAHTDLSAAKSNYEAGYYDASADRSYYAIFHAARAVLMLNGQDYKKHSGVIAFFNRDFYVVAKEDVEQQIKNAAYFISAIEQYLQTVFPDNCTE